MKSRERRLSLFLLFIAKSFLGFLSLLEITRFVGVHSSVSRHRLFEVPFGRFTKDTYITGPWMATEGFVLRGQENEPSWRRLLMEMVAKSAQYKARVEICQVSSQEQGRPPAKLVCPMSPSAGRGEEVGGLSVPKTELIPQSQLTLYIGIPYGE